MTPSGSNGGGPLGSPEELAAILSSWEGGLCVVAHHSPDGDALGSTLGLARLLARDGRDVVMVNPDDDPVPDDLSFLLLPGERVQSELPADIADRALVALDCASEERLWPDGRHRAAKLLINVDHHADNAGYGDVNLVDARASSVGELLVRVAEAAGWTIGPDEATPLYVAMVTDSGRFGYSSTRPETHRVASVLLAAGAEPAEVNRRLYEDQPLARLLLTGRALARATPMAGDRLIASWLGAEDFEWSGTDDAEGIVEILRSARGAAAAVLARESGPPGHWRVSLRAADPALDVAAIAHESGGGGHPAAAGFSTTMAPDELLPWIEERILEALDGE